MNDVNENIKTTNATTATTTVEKEVKLIDLNKVNANVHSEILQAYGQETVTKYQKEIFDNSEEEKLKILKVTEDSTKDYANIRIKQIKDKINNEYKREQEELKKIQENAAAQEKFKQELTRSFSEMGLSYEEGVSKLNDVITKNPSIEELVKEKPEYKNDPVWIKHIIKQHKDVIKESKVGIKSGQGSAYVSEKEANQHAKKTNHELSQEFPAAFKKAKELFNRQYKGTAFESQFYKESLSKYYNPE